MVTMQKCLSIISRERNSKFQSHATSLIFQSSQALSFVFVFYLYFLQIVGFAHILSMEISEDYDEGFDTITIQVLF